MTIDIVLIVAAALFVSWMIGANSVSSTFGPVAGLGAGGVLRGALLAGVAGLIGAFVQGSNVAGTIGSGLLVGGNISSVAGSVVLISASILIVIGIFFNIPIPTAFTVVGGVLGVGLGLDSLSWNTGNVQIVVATWVVIPFVAIFLGYLFSKTLRSFVGDKVSERKLAMVGILFAGFCAYTAGANLVGLAIGPLMNSVDVPLRMLLLLGGGVILIGAWLGGPRIVNAVSKDYSEMGVVRGICTLATASIIAQTATIFGIPVSFNEAVIMSLIGSGLSAGVEGVQVEKIAKTVISWTASFFVSMIITYFLISRILI